jgi:hypothetical protein
MYDNDFDALIAEGLRSEDYQRLLLVLLKVDASDQMDIGKSQGTLTPVMVNDIELTPKISHKALLEEIDSVGPQWDMVMVSTVSNVSGATPSGDGANPLLEKMAGDVLQGRDLTGYAIFDRDGTRLVVNQGSAA